MHMKDKGESFSGPFTHGWRFSAIFAAVRVQKWFAICPILDRVSNMKVRRSIGILEGEKEQAETLA